MGEVVVEEWLNRNGYFTIRGVKLGNDEMDILAIRILENGVAERRHVEVSLSVNPIGYFSTGNAKRMNHVELSVAVNSWIRKKFDMPKKVQLLNSLGSGLWSREFVIHRLRHQEEIDMIAANGIKIWHLSEILKSLRSGKTRISKASGSDLLELISFSSD